MIRIVLTLATVVLVLGLMAVALVTMLFVIIFSVLSGRKPKIDVSGFKRARQFRAGGRPGAQRKPAGEVIDVDVREVPDQPPAPLK